MTTWDFPCSEPVDISVDSWLSGSIAISGEPTSSILVEVLPTFDGRGAEELLQELQVSFDDGRLYVRGPRYASHRRKTSLDLIIKTPAGSSLHGQDGLGGRRVHRRTGRADGADRQRRRHR